MSLDKLDHNQLEGIYNRLIVKKPNMDTLRLARRINKKIGYDPDGDTVGEQNGFAASTIHRLIDELNVTLPKPHVARNALLDQLDNYPSTGKLGRRYR